MPSVKIITGAVAYREKKGAPEWFIVKTRNNEHWELPKSDVRGGESSVSAILRYMKESLGIKAQVLEEAARAKLTITANGAPVEQNLFFYIMRQSKAMPEDLPFLVTTTIEGDWVNYSTAKRRLELVREQKALTEANNYVKQWQKTKTKKPRKS